MKVIIIGTGFIAWKHASALKALGSELLGAYDIIAASRERFINEFGGKSIATAEELEAFLPEADYCVLCTPPSTRVPYVEMIVRSGVPVLMEKPIATTMEDAQRITELVEAHGGRAAVGFSHRYRPPVRMLCDAAASGRLGEPVNLSFQRMGLGYGFRGQPLSASWRTNPKLVCGMTIESLSHDLNLMMALCRCPVKSVSAEIYGSLEVLPQFDNNAGITMRLQNGGIATVSASWSSDISYNMRAYMGTKGTAFIRGPGLFEFEEFTIKTEDMPYAQTVQTNDSYDNDAESMMRLEHEDVQRCLKTGDPFYTPLQDGVDALRISLAALQSSQEHRVVEL